MSWVGIDEAVKDGRKYLVKHSEDDEPYIAYWVDDVYEVQGGSGGPSGWFSGSYYDHWGDRPILHNPKFFHELP